MVKGEDYNATFLPEVALEQGWDQVTTIRQLARKAGYSGSIEKIMGDIKLTTYESSKCTLAFKDWEEAGSVKII